MFLFATLLPFSDLLFIAKAPLRMKSKVMIYFGVVLPNFAIAAVGLWQSCKEVMYFADRLVTVLTKDFIFILL